MKEIKKSMEIINPDAPLCEPNTETNNTHSSQEKHAPQQNDKWQLEINTFCASFVDWICYKGKVK
jgi:hypothetical protein